MAQTLVHRGPDDQGYYHRGPIGLGFRRLSIIDLAGGHQPMSDREGTIWIVFNGEIYNFPELKNELEGLGHTFQTRSDTEIIIYGYKQWGEKVFDHLNGMFGIGLWDERGKKLLLARDAMGIKLVYYKVNSDSLYFGSEIRSILAVNREKADIDVESLRQFLQYRYTPSPTTLYQGIKKLAPGTMLIAHEGAITIKRWYQYEPVPFDPQPNAEELGEELLAIYKRSVKRHLLSDVPLGLLLSGGIDSGLLLGLMHLYGNDWPTYTVGYGKSFRDDELEDAAETARIMGSKNYPTELTLNDFQTHFENIVACLEEPIASSSIIPMYFVCKRARQDVKVALIGQGPDELFGGYTRHLGVRYGRYWRSMPDWLRGLVNGMVGKLPRNETLKRGVYSLSIENRMQRYRQVFAIVSDPIIHSLFQEGVLPLRRQEEIPGVWQGLEQYIRKIDELGGFQYLELCSSLPDELLMYADKLSMAHSLEVRVPFLDREIVEFAERLPEDFKIRGGCRKWLHRKICRRFLPSTIIKRKKRGFAVNVVDSWFRKSLIDKMQSYLFDQQSLMYRFLKPKVVAGLLQDHQSARNDNHKILYSLTVLEQWLRLRDDLSL